MLGPLSPSKSSMLVKTSGGMTGTGIGGGGEVVGADDGIGEGKQKSTHSLHIRKDKVPAYSPISALAVARNGLPRMIGI